MIRVVIYFNQNRYISFGHVSSDRLDQFSNKMTVYIELYHDGNSIGHSLLGDWFGFIAMTLAYNFPIEYDSTVRALFAL